MLSKNYALQNIPTAYEAKKKAEVVRSTKLSAEEEEVMQCLGTLGDNVRAAIEETLPNKDGGYTILVPKKSIKKYFDKVMNLFHTDMQSKGWTVVYEERIHYFPFKKTELVITFAPTPEPLRSSVQKNKEKSSKASSTIVNSDSDFEGSQLSLRKKRSKSRSHKQSLQVLEHY